MSNKIQEHQTTQEEILMLYQFLGCPFCTIAEAPIHRLGIDVEYRDTIKNPQFRQELINELGRATVPVLRIISKDGTEKWLPESRDIVRFIEKKYG
ncbi:glutathione S-transferase N-terminal domain-containing protein [Shewanella eurypsychrophilus]|uniref:Glutathione S-transferase N-terminal domain-containing protein n=1 Tax=Shewanella eurypsychrophilus TaxID=2593656 RepID=A0ABX6V8N3_9GAMM|nr:MULTISPECIES: glutaredoxin domain-containing protein [Shewanella]QFU23063.1 glutaredoxin [Shewanella sp. YLB-09]QPG58346.1 glutathione S-transferase N-terminal domain-containing protein [Shewanella eurypsychrophilus]